MVRREEICAWFEVFRNRRRRCLYEGHRYKSHALGGANLVIQHNKEHDYIYWCKHLVRCLVSSELHPFLFVSKGYLIAVVARS